MPDFKNVSSIFIVGTKNSGKSRLSEYIYNKY